MKKLKYLIFCIAMLILALGTVARAETNTIEIGATTYTYDEAGNVVIDGYYVTKDEYELFLSQVEEDFSVTSIEVTGDISGIDGEAFVSSQSTLRELIIHMNVNFLGYNIFGEEHSVNIIYAGNELWWSRINKQNDDSYFGDVGFYEKGYAQIRGVWADAYGDKFFGRVNFFFADRDCVAEINIYSYNENGEKVIKDTRTMEIKAGKQEVEFESDFECDGNTYFISVVLYDNLTNREQWGEVIEREFIAYDNSCICNYTSVSAYNSQLTLYMEFLYVENDCVAYVEIMDYDDHTPEKTFVIDIPAGSKEIQQDIPFKFDGMWHFVKISFFDNMTDKNELFDFQTSEFFANMEFNSFLYDYIDDDSVKITGFTGYASDVSIPVTIADYTVEEIGEDAFDGHSEIQSIILHNNIKKIGKGAFDTCTELTTVNYIDTEESWDKITIEENNAPFTSAKVVCNYIPQIYSHFSVRYYDGKNLMVLMNIDNCYVDCLAQIELFNLSKNETTFLYYDIPSGTSGETEITIPMTDYDETFRIFGSVVSVDKSTYYSVPDEMMFFTPSADVNVIEDGNFYYYVNEEGAASILRYRGGEDRVVIPDALGGYPVTRLDGWSVSGLNMSELVLGKNLKHISYGALSYNFNLENIIVDPQNTYFKFEDGVLYNADKTEIVLYLMTNQREHFDIPDSVEVIGAHAFEAVENLKSISVPEGLKRLERQAFSYSGLSGELILPEGLEMIGSEALVASFSKIHIPKTTTLIAKDAFAGSMGMTEITVHKDNPNYTAVSGVLYSKDRKILIKYPEAKADESFKIPGSVTVINEGAFVRVDNLTEVIIPTSIKLINNNAFVMCNNLRDVRYKGTANQWKSMQIGYMNDIYYIENVSFSGETNTKISSDGKIFTVTFDNVDAGKTVILALYDGNRLVEVQKAICNGENVDFTATNAYTNAKVMVWNSLSDSEPVFGAEVVK